MLPWRGPVWWRRSASASPLASLPVASGRCITGTSSGKPGNSMICLRRVRSVLLLKKNECSLLMSLLVEYINWRWEFVILIKHKILHWNCTQFSLFCLKKLWDCWILINWLMLYFDAMFFYIKESLQVIVWFLDYLRLNISNVVRHQPYSTCLLLALKSKNKQIKGKWLIKIIMLKIV